MKPIDSMQRSLLRMIGDMLLMSGHNVPQRNLKSQTITDKIGQRIVFKPYANTSLQVIYRDVEIWLWKAHGKNCVKFIGNWIAANDIAIIRKIMVQQLKTISSVKIFNGFEKNMIDEPTLKDDSKVVSDKKAINEKTPERLIETPLKSESDNFLDPKSDSFLKLDDPIVMKVDSKPEPELVKPDPEPEKVKPKPKPRKYKKRVKTKKANTESPGVKPKKSRKQKKKTGTKKTKKTDTESPDLGITAGLLPPKER